MSLRVTSAHVKSLTTQNAHAPQKTYDTTTLLLIQNIYIQYMLSDHNNLLNTDSKAVIA